MDNILKQIYDCLNDGTIKIYFPTQHKGECLEPYIVIKYGGAVELYTVSSERPVYTIMIYVPNDMYSSLENIMFETKQKLKKLYPLIQYNGNETPSFYDEDVNGNTISVDYVGIRKLVNW